MEKGKREELQEGDTVCAICDNGGRVLCCDGECNRCFHATEAHVGADSKCESLGLSKAELAAPKFFCLNCRYKEHQCSACRELGSSDCSSAQEVFRCASPSCGHFYHPECVADLLYPGNEAGRKNLKNKVVTGVSFTCPAHKCHVCKQDENGMVCELRFAICKHCPRAYHRKCLPREITYEEKPGLPQRAWCNLLPRKRVLIYCLKHTIQKRLSTPSRNHIVFPEVKTEAQSSPSSQQRVLKRKIIISEEFQRSVSAKKTKEVTPIKQSKSVENNVEQSYVQSMDSTKRLRTSSASEAILKESMKSPVDQSFKQQNMPTSSIGSELLIDVEIEKRMKMLINEAGAAFSLTWNDFKRVYENRVKPAKSKLANTANSQKKADGTDWAVRTALEKLEEHSKFDESNDVFDPKILNQITKWKVVDKLRAYVHKGDTVVNVSYSANDFTCSMKQRLEGSGKDCSFENYYVHQSKNVCTVEESDWLSVDRLATGSKLIIFLNIPVGISSALANNSIDKALDFKPKLLVMFVPENINRSEKKHAYELIWKDSEKLCKILPSSMRISDNKMKLWNSKPPVLYLCSRTDWCPEHKKIARLYGHMPISQNGSNVEGGKESEEEVDDNSEEGQEDQDHEQEEKNNRIKVVTSVPTNEDHSASPENLKPMFSAAPSENQEEKDKIEEDEEQGEDREHGQESLEKKVLTSDPRPEDHQFPDNSRLMPSSSHGIPPSENQEAFVFDFAPGPYRPYSHDKHSCCGWIDDE